MQVSQGADGVGEKTSLPIFVSELHPADGGSGTYNLPNTLRLRDVDVQMQPLDGLTLKHHVLGEDISGTTWPRHVSAGWSVGP